MAEAVNTGARKHINRSCAVDAHLNVCEAPLASSASDPLCHVITSENSTTKRSAPRYPTRSHRCRGRRDPPCTTRTRIGLAGNKCQNDNHNLPSRTFIGKLQVTSYELRITNYELRKTELRISYSSLTFTIVAKQSVFVCRGAT